MALEHGTQTSYSHGGCRCAPCRQAHAEAARTYYHSHPEYRARHARQGQLWWFANPGRRYLLNLASYRRVRGQTLPGDAR